MRFRGTLLLAALAVVLLAVVLLIPKAGDQAKESESGTLFSVREEAIHRITVTGDRLSISAVRSSSGWALESPLSAPGDREAWNAMAQTLATLGYDRVADATGSRAAEFGLEHPHLTVVFEDIQHKVRKVEFGIDAPLGDSCYARRDNDPKIYLVARSLRDRLQADLGKLREGSLLRFDPNSVTRVELERGAERITLSRIHFQWKLEKPLQGTADPAEVENLLRAVSSGRVLHHVDGVAQEELRAAFGTPRATLRIRTENGSQLTLEAGGDSPFPGSPGETLGRVPEREGVFTLPPDVLAAFLSPLERLRSHQILEFYPFEIRAATQEEGSTRIVVVRNSSDRWFWRTSGGDRSLDTARAMDLLSAFHALRVTAFEDRPGALSRYGLDHPAFRLTLDVANKPGLALEFGRREGDRQWVRNSATGQIVAVPARDAESARLTAQKMEKALSR